MSRTKITSYENHELSIDTDFQLFTSLNLTTFQKVVKFRTSLAAFCILDL